MDYTLLALIAGVPVLLVGQIYLLGRKMSTPEKMICPNPGGIHGATAGVMADCKFEISDCGSRTEH